MKSLANSMHLRAAAPWLAFAMLFGLQVLCIETGHVAIIAGIFLALGIGVCLCVYGALRIALLVFLISMPVLYFGFGILMPATLLTLPLLPILCFYVSRRCGCAAIPLSKEFLLLFLGFALSYAYVFFKHQDIRPELTFWYWDLQFFLCIVAAIVVYLALENRLVTIRMVLSGLVYSALFFVCFIVFAYYRDGMLGSFFSDRLGAGIGISANLVASALELALPAATLMAIEEKKVLPKLVNSLAAIVISIAILLTLSRGAFFGLTILGIYLIYRLRRSKALIALLAIVVLYGCFFGAQLFYRFQMKDFGVVISNASRVALYNTALQAIKANGFLFGSGMNSFKDMKYSFGFPVWFDPLHQMSSHNMYLEMWASYGLVGLLGWTLLLGRNLWSLARSRPSAENKWERWATFFGILSFTIHGFVDCALANSLIMSYLFILIGCAAFQANEQRRHPPIAAMPCQVHCAKP